MLKRQRPVSPPPSTPTVPLVESPDYNMISKRRRTMPPVLDGQSRGWGSDPDNEDEWSDEESASQQDSTADNGEWKSRTDNPGDYKSTNTMLHELHTQQQHRLLFAPPPPSPLIPGPYISTLHSSRSSPVVSEVHSKSTVHKKHQIPPATERPASQIKDPAFPAASTDDEGRPASMAELLRVKERYEDTNRLLKSLFLSRRRQLGSSEDPYPTS